MSSAKYLRNYPEGLEFLPMELERNFKLMRKLDDRAQTAMKSIDMQAKDFLRKLASESGSMSDEERKERLEDIKALFSKVTKYSDGKIQLATLTYELVDKQIEKLDNDLERFEGKRQEEAASMPAKTEEAVANKGGRKKAKDGKATRKKKQPASSDEDTDRGGKKKKSKVNQKKKSRKRGAKKNAIDVDDSDNESWDSTETQPTDVIDMPVNPDEATYCFCHQVSYGDMIACDNPDCRIEWFHFACVGVTTIPEGKWLCVNCKHGLQQK